jgi:hypothetical protein
MFGLWLSYTVCSPFQLQCRYLQPRPALSAEEEDCGTNAYFFARFSIPYITLSMLQASSHSCMIPSRLKIWSLLLLCLKALQYILSNLPMTIRFTSARGGVEKNWTASMPVKLLLSYYNMNQKALYSVHLQNFYIYR